MATEKQIHWADQAEEALYELAVDQSIRIEGKERDAIALVRHICFEIQDGGRG